MNPSRPSPRAELRVLDADDPDARSSWLTLWEDWPDREVMAHPEYVRLFARKGDRVLAATARTEGGGILYPFILRPLSAEPWCPSRETGWDLTSPYGYGGPFAWNLPAEAAPSFWAQFNRWAEAQPVITSFTRLSLFPEQLLAFDGDVAINSPNVVRGLLLSEEDLWNDYESKVRRNVRRALSRGCSFQADPDGARLEEFHHVYTATMRRRNASSSYFFPRELFESLRLRLRGHFVFFHVVHASTVVSTELVLLSHRHAYFFLGGTLAEAFDLRPGDLLQHETFRWCRSHGKTALVLGGGHRGAEGLLRYKQSFAPGGEVPFRTGTKTHQPLVAERLVEARRRWERARGVDWRPEAGFFPAYRAG